MESYGGTVAGRTALSRASLLEVPVVGPETPAREVLDLLEAEGRRVVVVDEGRVPLGVISDKDLLPLLDPKARHRLDGMTAKSLMREVPTISQDATIEEALSWMVEHRRQRLPVVDSAGAYVGMLSREELLRILIPSR